MITEENLFPKTCQLRSVKALERFVAEQVMRVLQPAALELSMAAEQTLRAEREQLEAHWHQRVERAHYNAQRAARQYEAVEPLCSAQCYVA